MTAKQLQRQPDWQGQGQEQLETGVCCKGNITGDTAGWSAFEFQLQLVSVRISTPTERLN